MSTIDAEAERIYDQLGRGEQTDVKTIRAALLAAEKRGKEEERNQIIVFISEQASAMAEMSMHGLPENSRVREAMEAALTQMSQIIRAAAIRGS